MNSPVSTPSVWSTTATRATSPGKKRMLSIFIRPQPTTLLGMFCPTMSLSVEEIVMAYRSAALGSKALAGVGVPVGYQPSVRYWRMSVMAPAPDGHDMLVPDRDT